MARRPRCPADLVDQRGDFVRLAGSVRSPADHERQSHVTKFEHVQASIECGILITSLNGEAEGGAQNEALIARAEAVKRWLETARECDCATVDVCGLFVDPTLAPPPSDFKLRVASYETAYEPLGEYEEKHDMQFIQVRLASSSGFWYANHLAR